MNFHNFFQQQFHQGNSNRNDEPVDNSRLYNILNVDKSATASTIKKQFYKLSKSGKYRHPDKGGDPHEFQKLQQAYEVLSDSNKRKMWDQYGEKSLEPNFQEMHNPFENIFGFNKPKSNNTSEKKSKPLVVPVEVTLEEICKGVRKNIQVSRSVLFDTIKKEVMKEPKNIYNKCKHCNGSGVIMKVRQIGIGMIQQMQTTCNFCKGQGVFLQNRYRQETRNETIEVYIEKGARDGDQICYHEKGNTDVGFSTGDLIVVVKEKPHDLYKRKENDLVYKYSLTVYDMLCGFRTVLHHPDGRKLIIKHDEIIQPTDVFLVKGGGLPLKEDVYTNGNLVFTVVFQMPKQLTPQQKQQLSNVLVNTPFIQQRKQCLQQDLMIIKENELEHEQINLDKINLPNYIETTYNKNKQEEPENGQVHECRQM